MNWDYHESVHMFLVIFTEERNGVVVSELSILPASFFLVCGIPASFSCSGDLLMDETGNKSQFFFFTSEFLTWFAPYDI